MSVETIPGTRPSPVRLARNALRGLWQELVLNATAYRPLPAVRTDRSVFRWLPARLRRWMAWAPHTLVGALAVLVLAIGSWDGNGMFDAGSSTALVVDGVIPMAAVLLTLIAPVAAFWLSLAGSLAGAMITPLWGSTVYVFGGATHWLTFLIGFWPWRPGAVLAHLVVLTVVAMRTRPRVAAWTWVSTFGYGLIVTQLLGRPTASDFPLLMGFSAVVLLGVAVLHVRRVARQEVTTERHLTAAERSRRTVLEERTTIARELHDVVAHHMSVVAIQAEAAPYRVDNPPAELTRAFTTIRENAVAALAELRRVLGVVRAEDDRAPDAPQPTLADLDALLANVREAGLSVDMTVTGVPRELPQGLGLSAYRIVQEALSNVLRHAPGAAAKVEVSYGSRELGLRVVNGPATAPTEPSPGAGHGLTGMRERVTMLGGEILAGPKPDGGYRVVAVLPVHADPVHDR